MTKHNFEDLIGTTCNNLVVVDVVYAENEKTKLKCKCFCGNFTYLFPYQVKNKLIKSCGCIRHQTPYNATHKLSKEKLYRVWVTMRCRCFNPKSQKYYSYGGRGITVCNEWATNYLTFRAWSLSHGYKQGLSLDRINNNGNYEPLNCRWATRKQQQRNRRSNIFFTYKDKTQTLIEWCETFNLPYKTICNRIYKGWDTLTALTTPLKLPKQT